MSIQESSQRPLPCVDITVYISYIFQRLKGRSMNDIMHDFIVFNAHGNDRFVSDFINAMPR